jgi:hypothetical protein
MYQTGVGVERSPVEAYYWLTLASRDRELAPTAVPRLDALRRELTSEELRVVEGRLAR